MISYWFSLFRMDGVLWCWHHKRAIRILPNISLKQRRQWIYKNRYIMYQVLMKVNSYVTQMSSCWYINIWHKRIQCFLPPLSMDSVLQCLHHAMVIQRLSNVSLNCRWQFSYKKRYILHQVLMIVNCCMVPRIFCC